MTTIEYLPHVDPDDPRYQLPAGFTEKVMKAVDEWDRRYRRRRLRTILAIGFVAVGVTYVGFSAMPRAVHYEIPVARKVVPRYYRMPKPEDVICDPNRLEPAAFRDRRQQMPCLTPEQFRVLHDAAEEYRKELEAKAKGAQKK